MAELSDIPKRYIGPVQIVAALAVVVATTVGILAWLDGRIAAHVQPLTESVSVLEKDVRGFMSNVSSKNDQQDSDIAYLKGRLAEPAKAEN